MSVIPHIPEHCNSLNVYLIVDDGRAAIDFYIKTFDGAIGDLMESENGMLVHASVRIGNSSLMLSEECHEWGMKSAKTLGGSPALLHLYVPNVDDVFHRAVANGCEVIQEPMDCFWGERMAKVLDPFGFQWGIGQQTEVLEQEEVEKRAAAWMSQMKDAEGQS